MLFLVNGRGARFNFTDTKQLKKWNPALEFIPNTPSRSRYSQSQSQNPQISLRHRDLCLVFFIYAIDSAAQAFDYADALSKSLLYFEAERSGRLPYNQRVSWRDHSGLTDGLEQEVDLVGGYYDADDHVKFGLPVTSTVTMLTWGALMSWKQIENAGEVEHTMEAIEWGTDYFINHTSPNVLWAEVGDGDTDHYCDY